MGGHEVVLSRPLPVLLEIAMATETLIGQKLSQITEDVGKLSQDVEKLHAALLAETKGIRQEVNAEVRALHADIGTNRDRMSTEMTGVREQMRAEISKVQEQMRLDVTRLDQRLSKIEYSADKHDEWAAKQATKLEKQDDKIEKLNAEGRGMLADMRGAKERMDWWAWLMVGSGAFVMFLLQTLLGWIKG